MWSQRTLAKDGEFSLQNNVNEIPKDKKWIVQEYIHNPFLIDGYKFDLRVYALITHIDPIWIYIYKEGLARFATEKYDDEIFDPK